MSYAPWHYPEKGGNDAEMTHLCQKRINLQKHSLHQRFLWSLSLWMWGNDRGVQKRLNKNLLDSWTIHHNNIFWFIDGGWVLSDITLVSENIFWGYNVFSFVRVGKMVVFHHDKSQYKGKSHSSWLLPMKGRGWSTKRFFPFKTHLKSFPDC